jgi:ketosteroid isomerase-like protein
MTRQAKWWVMVFLLGALVPAALRAEDEAAAIRKIIKIQESDWNRGDVESFMHGYKNSPETTFIGRTVRKGYQSILENYHSRYSGKEAMGTLAFSEIEVRLLPSQCGVKYAVTTGRYHLDRSAAAGGEASGVFDLVWEQTAEGWKIILDHTS